MVHRRLTDFCGALLKCTMGPTSGSLGRLQEAFLIAMEMESILKAKTWERVHPEIEGGEDCGIKLWVVACTVQIEKTCCAGNNIGGLG